MSNISNINTIVKPTRKDDTVSSLPQGAIFEYISGEAAYIKTDEGTIVNLRNGSVYRNASNGPNTVRILPWLRLETPV